MKKLITIAIMGVALVAGSVTGFADTYDDLSSQPVVIKVDGSEISSYDQEQGVDLPAVIVNGRTMLPLKRTFELFGVNTVWNGQERSITADTPNGRLWLQIDNDVAKLNGVDVQLDAAPTIFKSRTFVPLAFISESMGVKPLWNGNERSVTLNITEVTRHRLPKGYEESYLLTHEKLDSTDYYYNLANPNKSIIIVETEGTTTQAIAAAAQELHIEAADFVKSNEVGGFKYSFKDYDQNENHYVVRTVNGKVYILKFASFNLSEIVGVISDFNGGRI